MDIAQAIVLGMIVNAACICAEQAGPHGQTPTPIKIATSIGIAIGLCVFHTRCHIETLAEGVPPAITPPSDRTPYP
jgi:hypothetical protein